MSEAKFTKGEWSSDGEAVYGADGVVCYFGDNWITCKNSSNNSNLIKVAPEMYNALDTIKRHILNMPLCDSHLYGWVDENIEPLLAKARGEHD